MKRLTQKINFEIEQAEIIDENPESQFATAKIQAFSSGINKHNMVCSEEVLQNTAPTIFNKPILYSIDNSTDDFGTHQDPDKTLIAGFVVPDSAKFIRLSDGRLSFNVISKIWKRYASKVIELLSKDKGNKKVSVEMELYKSEKRPDSLIEMLEFAYSGICIIGNLITEASSGANIQVLSFAQEQEDYNKDYIFEFGRYEDIDFKIPLSVKDKVKKGLEHYKEYKYGGTSVALATANYLIKNEYISPDRLREIVKFFNRGGFDIKLEKTHPPTKESIAWYLRGGSDGLKWAKSIVELMDAIDIKQISYFGEVITMPYTSLKDVNPAIQGINPPVSLAQANAIAKDADAIGTDEKKNGWAIAISQFEKNHVAKDGKWVEKEKKEEMSVEKEFEDIEKKKEEEISAEDKAIMADKEAKKKEEDAKKVEEEKAKEKKEGEEFSLDANLDTSAFLAFLENETEAYKKLVNEMKKPKGINYAFVLGYTYDRMQEMTVAISKLQEENKLFATENEGLKSFKASEDAKAFQFAIDSTLKEIEATVEMPKFEIEALRESAKEFSLETIDAWKNSAKAKAFNFSSKKVDETKKDEKVKAAGLPWIRESINATGSLWKR